ncbi:unnamed protein product [Amoebophrya sp. A25]|nr:unnamed protein product [Amoebophrya sp. A25]|eukprot:GSA25T00020478001.1
MRLFFVFFLLTSFGFTADAVLQKTLSQAQVSTQKLFDPVRDRAHRELAITKTHEVVSIVDLPQDVSGQQEEAKKASVGQQQEAAVSVGREVKKISGPGAFATAIMRNAQARQRERQAKDGNKDLQKELKNQNPEENGDPPHRVSAVSSKEQRPPILDRLHRDGPSVHDPVEPLAEQSLPEQWLNTYWNSEQKARDMEDIEDELRTAKAARKKWRDLEARGHRVQSARDQLAEAESSELANFLSNMRLEMIELEAPQFDALMDMRINVLESERLAAKEKVAATQTRWLLVLVFGLFLVHISVVCCEIFFRRRATVEEEQVMVFDVTSLWTMFVSYGRETLRLRASEVEYRHSTFFKTTVHRVSYVNLGEVRELREFRLICGIAVMGFKLYPGFGFDSSLSETVVEKLKIKCGCTGGEGTSALEKADQSLENQRVLIIRMAGLEGKLEKILEKMACK